VAKGELWGGEKITARSTTGATVDPNAGLDAVTRSVAQSSAAMKRATWYPKDPKGRPLAASAMTTYEVLLVHHQGNSRKATKVYNAHVKRGGRK